MTSASYWASAFDAQNRTVTYMWNCEECPAAGFESTESEVVREMNAHMEDQHSDSGYVAPPVPD